MAQEFAFLKSFLQLPLVQGHTGRTTDIVVTECGLWSQAGLNPASATG